MGFVNLHVHSEYSLLDGMSKIEDIVDRSKQEGQIASCITDHGVLYSVPNHYQYAKEKGQKPILGFEAYVVQNHQVKDKNEFREHLVLLAKNRNGYKALSYLSSEGATKGFYYRPRIDDGLLERYGTKDLIALSACLAGRLPSLLKQDRFEEAERWAVFYATLFPESFYLELQPTAEKGQVKVNQGLIEIAKKLGLPLVATTDSHYTSKDQKEAHDMLLCMQSKDKWDNPDRWVFKGNTYWLMNEEEIRQAFKMNGHEVLDQQAVEEAIRNTEEIAKQCNVEFDLTKHYLPKLDPPLDDELFNKKVALKRQKDPNFQPDDGDFLKHTCIEGLKRLKPEILTNEEVRNKYLDRLNWELETIKAMRFPSYFLIVQEYINWASERMGVGPGRGCFTPQSAVQTAEGVKAISEVQVGDKVKGIDEKLHIVVQVLDYEADEEVVELDIEQTEQEQEQTSGFCCTKDHKVLAIRKEDWERGERTPFWYEAASLDEGDFVASLSTEVSTGNEVLGK